MSLFQNPPSLNSKYSGIPLDCPSWVCPIPTVGRFSWIWVKETDTSHYFISSHTNMKWLQGHTPGKEDAQIVMYNQTSSPKKNKNFRCWLACYLVWNLFARCSNKCKTNQSFEKCWNQISCFLNKTYFCKIMRWNSSPGTWRPIYILHLSSPEKKNETKQVFPF